ncbi:helix-turn-helix domain-containing protein [Zhongshania antarctica]|uniref:helix-turn-helix domain-containing protein n=1 Tax=Zhongshania antarctica TaxID=641702 RepID=UPI00161C2636|nr:AraC family transcriptional regulator [Zhongshania antarctica]
MANSRICDCTSRINTNTASLTISCIVAYCTIIHLQATLRNLKLTEVSSLLGYSEQSAFGRAFKQWHGTTPNRYRDLIKSEGLKYQNKI